MPLNTSVSYTATQPFAQAVAQILEREHPRAVVAEMSKSLRAGKVFIDWSQNADHKTTVGVYSLRAKRNRPFVSMPVKWTEVESALKQKSTDGLYFTADEAVKRLAKRATHAFANRMVSFQSAHEQKRATSAKASPPRT